MFFFKLMHLKKKKKLDNKGVALANVLLITTFAMVITSSVLSMAYNTYRMKLINVSSKDNFYACEAALEQVRVGFRNQFTAITDALGEDLDSTSLAGAFEEFYADYALDTTYSVSSGNVVGNSNKSEGIYFYDIYKVAQLLTSITGTDNAELIFNVDASDTYAHLDYDDTTPVFTSEIEITVNGYDDIKITLQANATGKNNFELTETYVTFHDLTVIYSENGYESQVTTDITVEFPETGTGSSGSSGGRNGWVTLMDNRVKTYEDWLTTFATDSSYDDFNFGTDSVPYKDNEVIYLNTTDYPANSVSYIIFSMERYKEYVGTDGTFDGTHYDTYYQYSPIYPWVQVQDGAGTGTQYAACSQGNFENVEIYIGGDETDDSSWVDFNDVFDSDYFIKDYDSSDTTSAVYKYVAYYGDILTSSNDSLGFSANNPLIKYRVHLIDGNGLQNSRGWILVTGGVYGHNDTVIQLDMSSEVQIYVDLDDVRSDPTYYFYNSGSYGTTGTTDAYSKNYIFMDLSESDYSVGDILHITLKYIDKSYSQNNDWYYAINEQVKSQSYYGGGTIAAIYPTASGYTGECTVSYDEDEHIIDIYIEMTWDTYPYLELEYIGGLDNNVTLTTEWLSSDGSSASSSSGTYDDASIYYQDWRKE